jgi:hypothetical protein
MADEASSLNRQRKRSMGQLTSQIERNVEGVLKPLEKPFRTGASSQKAQAKKEAEKQKQVLALDLAEAESEIARRKALTTKGRTGRGSLIASGTPGLSSNLGGTS